MWSLQRNGKGGPIGAVDLGGTQCPKLYWRPDGGALAVLDALGGVTVWQIGQAKGRIRRPNPRPWDFSEDDDC